MKIALWILTVLAGLVILGWVGLQVKPRPFAPYPEPLTTPETVPLPEGLPAPVERFYREVYGDGVPVIESAVVSGRARMRIMGITFPGRFRFTHDAGQGYRHYIEATLFGLPLMKVNEYYLEGTGRMELPFGVTEGVEIDQGANLGLWAESFWFPAVLVTDPRVTWEAVDEETALARLPFGEEEQTFVVRFDPETGLVRFMEAMRYKEVGDEEKHLWINEALTWEELEGQRTMTVGTATWFDDGTAWATFTVEEIVLNADVSEYIRAKGE